MNREDLKGYFYLDDYIKEQANKYEEQFARVTKMTQVIDGLPKAHNKPNYSTEELIDASIELIKLYNDETRKQAEIIKQLNLLSGEKGNIYKDILYKRYVSKKSFEKIAEEIHYNYYDTCRFHGEALVEFDKLDNKGE